LIVLIEIILPNFNIYKQFLYNLFQRENHFHLYTEILQLSTEEQRKIAIDKHTKDIESKVGRGSITKIISDKPVYWSKSSVETSLPDSKVQETSPQDDGNQIADEDQPHYKCKKCGMILAKERRVSHIIAVHMSCYKCRICQLSFPDHFYLQKHMTLIHKSKQVAPNANLNHQFKMIKWFSWHAVRGKTFPVDTSGRLFIFFIFTKDKNYIM
jgi:phage FluMu protein Com